MYWYRATSIRLLSLWPILLCSSSMNSTIDKISAASQNPLELKLKIFETQRKIPPPAGLANKYLPTSSVEADTAFANPPPFPPFMPRPRRLEFTETAHYTNLEIEIYIIQRPFWWFRSRDINQQLTSFILSFIFWFGWIFLPPVMFLVALILYHIFDFGWLSTTWTRFIIQMEILLDHASHHF